MAESLPIFSQAGFYRGVRPVAFHSHPSTELIWLTRGRCEITVGATIYPVEPGKLMVIAPESEHNQSCPVHVENLFTVFMADPKFFNSDTRLIEVGDDHWTGRLINDVVDLSKGRHYDLCDGILYTLLKHIRKREAELAGHGSMHPGLQRALALIERRFAEKLDIRDIARQSGVSPSYLRALFDARFRQSPAQYLQSFRMAHARELLLNRYMSVAEVALRCGYDDANYFTRLFRRIHHYPPGDYREIVESRDPERPIRL